MPQTHLVSEARLEETLEEAEENGRDREAISEMYVTPEEAVGRVFKKRFDWGYTFYEAVAVDYDEEQLILEELFTGEEYTEDFGDILHTPFIGDTHSVSWVEAKVDGDWTRVSDYATPNSWREPTAPKDKDYEQVRTVEKTYEHGQEKFESWPIRIEHRSGEPEVGIAGEDIQNEEVLEEVLDSIELPESFDLKGLEIGTVYTDTHIVEDGNVDKRVYEVVWWSVKNQFQGSKRDRVSPVTTLDRPLTV